MKLFAWQSRKYGKEEEMKKNLIAYMWLGIAFVCLGIGAIGVVLPVLPTTPFLLVASYCFCQRIGTVSPVVLRDRMVPETSGEFCERTCDDIENQALHSFSGLCHVDSGFSDDAESSGKDCDYRIDSVQVFLFFYTDQNSSSCLKRQLFLCR